LNFENGSMENNPWKAGFLFILATKESRMKKCAAALIVFAICSAPLFACDLCAIYRGTEARDSRPGAFFDLSEQFTHFGTLRIDGSEVPNEAGQYLDSSITQFVAGYQINYRFGAQLNVPYIHRSYARTKGFSMERGTESGIGDMSITGSARLLEKITGNTFFVWLTFGGIKFPTGSANRIAEELAEQAPIPGAPESGIHGHDLALGSGSYDGVAGTSAAYHYKRLVAEAMVQCAIRSRGAYGYRSANDLLWSIKPGYFLIADHSHTLGLRMALTGETKGKDDLNGEMAPDTGITSVFLGPEVSFTWKERVNLELGMDIPVLEHNSALQMVPDYKVRAGFVWRF
jgi:hypothetical protein